MNIGAETMHLSQPNARNGCYQAVTYATELRSRPRRVFCPRRRPISGRAGLRLHGVDGGAHRDCPALTHIRMQLQRF